MREESKDNRARGGIKQSDSKSGLVSCCPVCIPVTLPLVPVLGRWGREITGLHSRFQPAGDAQ